MRVLVTGSAGLIGSELVKTLRAGGHEVRTLDRIAKRNDEEGEHLPGDLRDIQSVRRAVQGVDAVAHLGAIPGDRRGIGDEVLTVNVQGTWNVLFACIEAGVGRAVCFSSINALGCVGGHRPAAYLPIDDAYPRHPLSPYQLSKHLAEETCRSFSEKHGIVTVCLRPMAVIQGDFGDWWRRSSADYRADWAKDEFWAYVDVRDVCDATLRALTVEGVTHDAFLLSAADTTMETPTAELVARYHPDIPWPTQERAAYLADSPYRALMDCSHAREVLGWVPKHSWRET